LQNISRLPGAVADNLDSKGSKGAKGSRGDSAKVFETE